MKTKHTPGPWIVKQVPQDRYVTDLHVARQDNEGSYVAIIDKVFNSQSATANARLIAAAPEMLEALEKIKETLDIIKGGEFFAMNYELLLVNRAIAKAKGDL